MCCSCLAAVAISAVAAVAYLAVTGVSIRDLYRSCEQVIQVKEEGLVTVQSLQPVLTPITPIAGKINYGKIAKAAEGGKVAVEDAGTSWGTKEGAAGKIADAGVKVAKDSAKVGAKIAKGTTAAGAIGGLVLGSVAGNVAQTTSLARLAARLRLLIWLRLLRMLLMLFMLKGCWDFLGAGAGALAKGGKTLTKVAAGKIAENAQAVAQGGETAAAGIGRVGC